MKLKRQALVSQGSLSRMLQTAEQAWQNKDFRQNIEILERASRLAPSNADILLRLGRAHGLRYDYATAERYFEQALRFTPQITETLTKIGYLCQYFINQEFMERYLRRALEQPDATPEACAKLAELYERLRRLPEAAELVERALKLNPAFPAALLVRARLERLAGRLESAEQVLRSFITKPVPDTWVHAQAWYELGNNLDRQKKFDDAMAAFFQAKTLTRPEVSTYLAELKTTAASLKMIESSISAGLLQRWFDDSATLIPARRLALLCGYPRSGTTLLEQVLDSHPDIVSAEETGIFNNDALPVLKHGLQPDAPLLNILEAANIPALQRGRAAYFRSMELAVGSPAAGRLLIDKNPGLTPQISAFVRIFPETRFLIALRDPRDVVLSRFMLPQPVVPGTAAFSTLEGTVEDYTCTMSLWRTLAPLMPSPYLEVRYEDMVEDLESVARRTLDFLGVSWDDRVLGFDEHARNKMVRSPTYADVTQPVYKRAVGRWRNYQKYLEPYLSRLEPFVKAFGYD